jgi:hypothetical protein
MNGVIPLLHHTSSWHDMEKLCVYFRDGGGNVIVVGNILIHGTPFGNLTIDSIRRHIEEVKILGEELKRM